MTADEIREVLREVFGRGVEVEQAGKWMSLHCPLSRWTHQSGKDSRPSAGISINAHGTSIFNCFTCGKPMPFHGMLRRYANYSGENLDDIIGDLEENAYLGPRSLPEWDRRKGEREQDMEPLDKDIFLDLYEPAAGHPYLVERGISDETADRLQLMVDPSDPADGEERILFPVFGLDGELYGFTGRATSRDAKLKVRDYMGLRKAHCVLGAHLFSQVRYPRVLVVEGLFDYANAWECGHPAVAVMHASMTEMQAAILRQIGLPSYLFYDGDEAGQKGMQTARALLARYQPTLRAKYPEVWIDNPREPEGGHWLKDPGEALAEELAWMVENARLY